MNRNAYRNLSLGATLTLLGMLLLAASATTFTAGCQSTPARKFDQAQNLYAATLEALSDLREAGVIDDATQRQVAKYREITERVRTKLLLTTQPADRQALLVEFNAAFDELVRIQVEADAKKKARGK